MTVKSTLCLAALSRSPCSRAHPRAPTATRTRLSGIIESKKFVDLTHSFGPNTPVWSGFGQAIFTRAYDPKIKRPYTIKEDGFRTTYYNMVGQYGTHVDPPAHFAEGGATMEGYPAERT